MAQGADTNLGPSGGKTAAAPLLDRIFEAGCTALFLVLLGCAMSAVWVYYQ